MNKYQEALDSIGSIPIDYDFVSYQAQEKGSNFVKSQFEILQELVDRATQEKVLTNKVVAFCPSCKQTVWQIKEESKFCFRCGKALDWTDNE